MAKKKIGDFSNKPTPANGDLFLLQDISTGIYYNVTKAQLAAIFGGTQNINQRYSFINDPLFIGDSFTLGTGASPIQESFVNKLAVNNNVIVQNGGIGGIGVWRACSQDFQTRPSSRSVNPTVWLCGFNDLRRAGNNAATYEKIKGALKSVVLNTWANTFTPASTVTNTGAWSNASGYGGKCEGLSTGSARQSSTIGNTLTYTSPVSSNVVIGCFGSDGTIADCGRFTVTIDGVLIETFTPNGKADGVSDGVYNNAITQNALLYENLSNTTHTVVVTLLDAKPTIIDYFGTLGEPNLNPAVFVLDIPKMTTAGYATAPANASDAIMDLGIAAQKSIIDSFVNRPIIQIKTNDYLNLSTDISGDNVHPNNLGHTHIAQAIQDKIKSNSDFMVHGKTNNPTNTVIGDFALNSDYVNDYNTVFGNSAMYSNDLGSQNVAIGYYAMRNVTGSSNYNVAIGMNAMKEGASVTNSVAIGHGSLSSLTSGIQNIAIGLNALQNLLTTYNNVSVGALSGRLMTTGAFNSILGTEAYKSGNGSNCVVIGYNAGGNATGSGCVFIGFQAGLNETNSNKLYIDNSSTTTPLLGGDFSTNSLTKRGVEIATVNDVGITRSVLTGQSGSVTAGATAKTDYVYIFTASGTLTLPTAVGNTNRYTVKNRHSSTITVNFTGGQNADGSTSITLQPYQSLDFISDNSNYNII